MKEYRFMKLQVFYYNYLLILTMITSVMLWFDGSPAAFLCLAILLAVPYLISKAGLLLNRAGKEEDGKGNYGKKNARGLTCHAGLLGGAGIVASPGAIVAERPESSFLCCLLYVAAIGVYFYWRYYSGKYMVLYRNPSVSENTRLRAENRMQNSLAKLVIIAAAVTVLIFVAANFVPEVEIKPPRTESTPAPKQVEEKNENRQLPAVNTGRPRLPEDEAEDNVLLTIVRYVAWVLVAVFAVIGLVLILFKVVMFFLSMRHTGEYEYYEMVVEKTDNEEYSKLIPVVRREIFFPAGNEGKVRRAFYRAVKKGAAGSRVERSRTPQELRERYLTEKEDSEFLTELYEKARYSGDGVTDEEVSRLH